MTYLNRTFARRLRPFQRHIDQTKAAVSSTDIANPFGNSAQLTEVVYVDQINHVSPPNFSVVDFFPPPNDVATNGLTVELWFKAESSGILVGLPMDAPFGAQAVAPLLYIDSKGFLRGGLFDSTQITLVSPQQNLVASLDNNDLIVVGPLNALASPLSVVDGQWHHVALAVQPGNDGSQSLFLDGRLAATNKANGSFGFSFIASDGTSWQQQTNAPVPFGGSITPQPQSLPSPNFLPYAQGFCGCLNEIRCWNSPRTATQIQQLIQQPLGGQWSNYQSQGLFAYVGSSFLQQVINAGTYQVLTSDAPPFDPFSDVDNRIPGYQNFGMFFAIPFTTVALEVTFAPSQTYSTKISLWQADQLQVAFPGQDANGDNLSSNFSMTLTNGSSGYVQTIEQISPGSVFTITAPLTGSYRLDFSYVTSSPVTIDNLQFMLVPGPSNTLMQLLLDIVPLQTAYTDPNYPITETKVNDPRYPGQIVTLPAYWPQFTDQSVFPIDSNQYSSDDLLSAYLNFNQTARQLTFSGGPTFYDFFNLSANSSTISDVSDLKNLLETTYTKLTGNSPSPVPSAPFESANDQIYAFIYNVNSMRNTLNEFFTSYQDWAQAAVTTLALSQIPEGIANQIYNQQEKLQVSLKGPSTKDFILNLVITSVILGVGAVAAPLLLPEAVVAAAGAAAITVGFLGSAGANALSDWCGSYFSSSTVKAKLSTVSYTTLEVVKDNVNNDMSNAYKTIITHLLDPAYVQTFYSNYGLLQALRFVSAQPLFDANSQPIQPDPDNSLTIGLTYASWQALIPSVFSWSPQSIGDIDFGGQVFIATLGLETTLPNKSVPTQLGIYQILHSSPSVFYSMVASIQEWQTATKTPRGQFFSVCPIFIDFEHGENSAVWVITWSLQDQNGHSMSDALAASLFGIGDSNIALSLVDQNYPLVPAGYGWYCQIANGAVTTPFDAFMNWGEGLPSYSPQILAAQLPEQGKLHSAKYAEDDVSFAAAAASDTPPPSLVTLEPSVWDFGNVTTGSSSATLTAVLTNNELGDFKSFKITPDYNASVFSVTQAPVGTQPTSPVNINVVFSPTSEGIQSGEITVNATGQYGSITLTLEFSGTGVAS
jgi:hypothetical protein